MRIKRRHIFNSGFKLSDGSTILDSNLSSTTPNTVRFSKLKNLSFPGCNLKNIVIQPTWNIDGAYFANVHEEIDTTLDSSAEESPVVREVRSLSPKEKSAFFEKLKPEFLNHINRTKKSI